MTTPTVTHPPPARPVAATTAGYQPPMRLTNRAGAMWAILVFVLIGCVFIVIGLLQGDDTDMEQQPEDGGSNESAAVLVLPAGYRLAA